MKQYLLAVTIVIFAAAVSGCGGGTTGTGGLVLKGSVKNQEGAAVPGAVVTVMDTGDSTTTDDNGNFSIDVSEYSSDVTVLIETEQRSASAAITGVPEDAEEVEVDFRVDWERSIAETTRVDVRKKKPHSSSSSSAASSDGVAASSPSADSGAQASSGSSANGQGHGGSSAQASSAGQNRGGNSRNNGNHGHNANQGNSGGASSKPDKPAKPQQKPDKPSKERM